KLIGSKGPKRRARFRAQLEVLEIRDVPAAPIVTAVSPIGGELAGGTLVTISGTNLSSATSVNFGSVSVPSTSFISDTSNSITLDSPAESAGTVDVTVTTGGGTSATSSVDHFTFSDGPIFPSISPVSANYGAAPTTVPLNAIDGLGNSMTFSANLTD